MDASTAQSQPSWAQPLQPICRCLHSNSGWCSPYNQHLSKLITLYNTTLVSLRLWQKWCLATNIKIGRSVLIHA